jgi:CheY-like chemotaxis protein
VGAVLTHHGFKLTAVSSVPQALELISTQKFDVLLSDLNIGEPGDGLTVVSEVRPNFVEHRLGSLHASHMFGRRKFADPGRALGGEPGFAVHGLL